MTEPSRHFLRFKQVKAKVGLGHTKIHEMIKAGEFPRPYPLGPRAVGYLSTEIEAWIDSRIAAANRDSAGAA